MRSSLGPAAWLGGLVALSLACTSCATGTAADTGRNSASRPAGSQPGGGEGRAAASTDFAPYVSATTAAGTDTAGSPDTYNLAFVVADGDSCTPTWGGTSAYDDATVKSRAAKLKSTGSKPTDSMSSGSKPTDSTSSGSTSSGSTSSGSGLRVSFGGAAGTELALACGSADRLAAAYAKALDAVGATGADFDIEGDALTDTASITLRNKAIAQLQQERDLDITYTLPVMPDGLEESGTAVLADAVERDVDISAVNVMAMNYGSSYDGDMGDYAEQAAEAAHDQIAGALGLSSRQAWKSLHITAMIGVNDVAAETFTLQDAAQLRAFATEKGVGALSMWSTFRDRRCADGTSTSKASDTCSGVEQTAGAFAKALAG
ncbi:chitinase [Streptomyces sp. NPDC088116]|uniref:chitinase n=1 Tax=Streptomyces sp. NPDC088116 TaxID=3365825 RepID=UPI0037F2424D